MQTKLVATAVALLLLSGCASVEEETASSADEISQGQMIAVDATWHPVVTGTPTYGYDATTPAARVEVTIDDREVRRAHPGFDGLEKPFVVIGDRRIELPFRYTSQVGYIQLRPVDIFKSDTIWLTDVPQTVKVGIDTNVGTFEATYPLVRD